MNADWLLFCTIDKRKRYGVGVAWALAFACLSLLSPARACAKEGAFAGIVNLNTASPQELERLPGVGASKANKIIEHRQRRPFRTVAELVRVKGFGIKTLQKLRPFLTVSEPTRLEGAPTSASCVCPTPAETAPVPATPKATPQASPP